MRKKRAPRNCPNWTDPASSPVSSTKSPRYSSTSNSKSKTQDGNTKSAQGNVQAFMFSTNWTLIKAGDNFYAEYHGSLSSEELDSGKNGIVSFLFTLTSKLKCTLLTHSSNWQTQIPKPTRAMCPLLQRGFIHRMCLSGPLFLTRVFPTENLCLPVLLPRLETSLSVNCSFQDLLGQ